MHLLLVHVTEFEAERGVRSGRRENLLRHLLFLQTVTRVDNDDEAVLEAVRCRGRFRLGKKDLEDAWKEAKPFELK